MRKSWDAREIESRTALDAFGVKFVTDVDRATFKALMQPVYVRYLNGKSIDALVAEAEATQRAGKP